MLSERPGLRGPARSAVATALDDFAAEDGALPLPAARIRRFLDSRDEPARDTSAETARPGHARHVLEFARQLVRALAVPRTHERPAGVAAHVQSVRLGSSRLHPDTPR